MGIKNILIITYDWPPRNSIAVYRPYEWAKEWASQGVAVTVITARKCAYDEPLGLDLPPIEGVNVVEVAYRDLVNSNGIKTGYLSKIQGAAVSFAKKHSAKVKKITGANYDIRDNWAKVAISVAIDICQSQKFDIVISTYGPRACHFIGAAIKQSVPGIKWMADYRDLWSIRHDVDLSKSQIKREGVLELKVIKDADFLSTVSDALALDLSTFAGKKVLTVFNGFDAEWHAAIKKLEAGISENVKPQKIKIVYTGIIYAGSRDPSPLFAAINNLINANKLRSEQVEVHFFGHRQPGIHDLISAYSAESFSKVHGHVSREMALREQESADLLLLLESGENVARGVLTGKIFEYMVSGTPILSLGSKLDSAIGELIMETGVGVVCEADLLKIESVLLSVLSGERNKIYTPNLDAIKKYSRKTQAESLLHHLNELAV